MFTATTFYRICIGLVGAASVRGDCSIEPDKDGSVVIPDGTEAITPGAFNDCDALKKIVIPASVKYIGAFAFHSAVNLKKVVFREGSNLEEIVGVAFTGCVSLKKFDFPKSLKKIGAQAFRDSGLQKVSFKNGIGYIGNDAFRSCNIKKITFPRSLKTIGKNAFYSSGLEVVIFSTWKNPKFLFSRLQKIGPQAFQGNEKLKTINIPTLLFIGKNVFKKTGCPSGTFIPGVSIKNCIVIE